ncbi:hypothetical protein FKW77_003833 [Venturia effusa]|uniref:Carboxypeptidase n=1 Tax=Venturia effusa TaxID=50376 RepID=A0A517L309_9PEZI|nr:hypothetical protein FKW77_003833 [Venturia effusa]
MYSGLMPVKAGDLSRQLFFIFQPTTGPPVDTITIWLNGGPGCSSLEGFFQENGRFVWHDGQPAPTLNDHSWVNITNMLWVEQPIGTGFTVGTPTATSEEDIANDFVGFFRNFQETFGIKNFKIYAAGESYAGRYVSYISSAFLDQKDKSLFDLKGALVYDPCIGAYDTVQQQVPVVPFVKANNDLFGFDQGDISNLEQVHESCGYEGFLDKYLKFPPAGLQPAYVSPASSSCDLFTRIQYAALAKNRCFDIYMINKTCPRGLEVMKPSESKPSYFDRADVKAALNVPASSTWALCSEEGAFVGSGGPYKNGDFSADPIQAILPKVVEATKRVLVANGNYDMIILTNGTLLAIQNMTWGGSLGFQNAPATPIDIPGRSSPAGIQHYERGLMWSEGFKTGHMVLPRAQHLRLLAVIKTMAAVPFAPHLEPSTDSL